MVDVKNRQNLNINSVNTIAKIILYLSDVKKELNYTGQTLSEKDLKSMLIEAEVNLNDDESNDDESDNNKIILTIITTMMMTMMREKL